MGPGRSQRIDYEQADMALVCRKRQCLFYIGGGQRKRCLQPALLDLLAEPIGCCDHAGRAKR
tara:strand:- start:3424 stop:3609 length:186 start_codon:yes stop_codon:yes gene_type:complete